ncbi:MAG: flagellar biosynthesis protein FlhF [Gammaproteobacteria bacterium]|nr:flagellar biosynthesis protein FlhF [Gammaproteobacteria bacterium]MDH5652172.1 flagellar biosynthesis protein FlhF [Gammaproteobacteria bacterium]
MKIKRFFAADMRRTILKVRETLGPDAVILSNKRVEGGIEIVAAVDYDESLFSGVSVAKNEPAVATAEPAASREEIWNDIKLGRYIPEPTINKEAAAAVNKTKRAGKSSYKQDEPAITEMRSELKSLRGLLLNQLSGLAWGNETQFHPARARLLQRLIALGLSPGLARQIAEAVKEEDDFEHNWRLALGNLAHRIETVDDRIIDKGGIVALVGATGVGKTTTIAKLAARYILRHGKGKVGLISTDNYRVGAHEQLKSYARIMGAPLCIASDVESITDAFNKFRDKDLILIDTAGMNQRDMELTRELIRLRHGGKAVQTYLVMATNSQRGVLTDVTRAFNGYALTGCILTKVDETTSLGGALSVAIENKLPVAYFNDGQKVPEDIHPARAHNLVTRCVSIMQNMGGASRDDQIALNLGGMVAHAHG